MNFEAIRVKKKSKATYCNQLRPAGLNNPESHRKPSCSECRCPGSIRTRRSVDTAQPCSLFRLPDSCNRTRCRKPTSGRCTGLARRKTCLRTKPHSLHKGKNFKVLAPCWGMIFGDKSYSFDGALCERSVHRKFHPRRQKVRLWFSAPHGQDWLALVCVGFSNSSDG